MYFIMQNSRSLKEAFDLGGCVDARPIYNNRKIRSLRGNITDNRRGMGSVAFRASYHVFRHKG